MVRRKWEPSAATITTRQVIGEGSVKSAGRIIQILEFFDDIQRAATIVEVAGTLGYPRSSTAALMKTLARMGYLDFAAAGKTFVTSSRVGLLGNWVSPDFVSQGRIINLMKALGDATGDTILLASRVGLMCQYIHAVQAKNPARLHVTLGTTRPLVASAVGYAILSRLPNDEIKLLVMRANAESPDAAVVRIADVLRQVDQVRERGYVLRCNTFTKGGGILASPLPKRNDGPVLVLGIAGISEVLMEREKSLAKTLRSLISEHLQDPDAGAATGL